MVHATRFFESPPMDMCSIFSQVIAIVVEHFKTFAILAALRSVAMIPVLLLFGFMAYESFSSVANLGQTMYPGGGGGDLDGQSAYDYGQETFDTSEVPSAAILEFVGLFFGFVIASMCVAACFQGAFVRAASEAFAGHTPNWRGCLESGWKKMCPIICFVILCMVLVEVTSIAWFLVTLIPQGDDFNIGLTLLFILIWLTALFVFLAGMMTGGISSIVVENKSSCAAVGRSWELCRSKICFVFCCVFCFQALEIVCSMVVNGVLNAIAASITGGDDADTFAVTMVASWLIGLFLGPLHFTIGPLIYFSLRIQKEGLGIEELRGELSLVDNSIELQTGGVDHAVPVMEDPSLKPITCGITKATVV